MKASYSKEDNAMALAGRNRSALWFIWLAAFILLFDSAAVLSLPSADTDRVLGYAVVFDFAIVIPLLYWLLVARCKGKSVLKAAPFTIAGAVVAWLVLPASLRGQVWDVVWPIELLIAAVEIALIGYELRMLYRFVQRFRRTKRFEPDMGEALRIAAKEAFGASRIASLVQHDVSVVYYLLFSWKRKRAAEAADGTPAYSYHRKTSLTLYAGLITHIVVFEAVFLHLLVQQWSPIAAWVLTAADVWIVALLWADCRASALCPIRLTAGTIRLRYGLRIQADVPLDSIAAVSAALSFEPDAAERKRFATPLLGTPNVRIELKRPQTMDGLLFLPREVNGFYLAVDDPQAFVRDIAAAQRE